MVANILKRKIALRAKRKIKIRSKISGTAAKPRLSIFKSNKTIYAQVIDDTKGVTLCASNGTKLGVKANKDGAKIVGKDIAQKIKSAGLEEVVFDRNGYLYHGVIAEFAQSVRENGVKL